MNNLISIVLPTYNGQEYIEEAIESILNQTYKNFELIIVNDCSTDNTQGIIENYKCNDNRIRIINNKINKKLPASLNIGFAEANGDFFTWTSDDNKYKVNALEILLNEILKSGCDLVFSDYDIIDKNGNSRGQRICMQKSIDEILCSNIIGASFLYRKEIHQKLHGYDENKFLVEDYDFWLRAYFIFSFQYISQSLYEYREHENSLSATRNKKIQEQTINLWNDLLNNKELSDESKYKIAFNISDRYRKEVPDIRKRIEFLNVAKKYGKCNILKILISDLYKKMRGV